MAASQLSLYVNTTVLKAKSALSFLERWPKVLEIRMLLKLFFH